MLIILQQTQKMRSKQRSSAGRMEAIYRLDTGLAETRRSHIPISFTTADTSFLLAASWYSTVNFSCSLFRFNMTKLSFILLHFQIAI